MFDWFLVLRFSECPESIFNVLPSLNSARSDYFSILEAVDRTTQGTEKVQDQVLACVIALLGSTAYKDKRTIETCIALSEADFRTFG